VEPTLINQVHREDAGSGRQRLSIGRRIIRHQATHIVHRPSIPLRVNGCHTQVMLHIDDADRVRLLRIDRPEALNALDEVHYDALADALDDARTSAEVAVVVLTGTGRAFCAGTDLGDMERRKDPDSGFVPGQHGFAGFMDRLSTFPKPVVVAVNGLGIGIGATVIGHADLVFMSSEARLQCPFTALGVVPEAASSYLFPRLLNRQDATWVLMSSEWIDAQECLRMGLAWRLCAPEALMDEAMSYARRLAAKPVASLVASKQLLTAPLAEAIAEARVREDQQFAELMGGPANAEALRAFAEKRPPDFTGM